MKKYVYALFILCVNFSIAQNSVDARGKKQGVWEKKLPQSNVVDYIGQFKDDIPIGTFIYYFPSGKKKKRRLYINQVIQHFQQCTMTMKPF